MFDVDVNAYVLFSLFLLMSPFYLKTAIAISIMEVTLYLGYDMSAKRKLWKKILKPEQARLKTYSEILKMP